MPFFGSDVWLWESWDLDPRLPMVNVAFPFLLHLFRTHTFIMWSPEPFIYFLLRSHVP